MAASKAALKKDLRTRVSRTLEEVFREFEPLIGQKKFRRNIKKASRFLTASVKPGKVVEGKFNSSPLDNKFDGEPAVPSSPLSFTKE